MNLSKTKKVFLFLSDQKFIFVILALFAIISFAHLFRLESVPGGLYWDETSIGYNAATISQAGVDENGYQHPIYFTTFGENKNPVYIYSAAIIFKLFGVSDFNLRFTSFLFYIFGLIFTYLLVSRIFTKNKIVQVYLILSFGFLPQFFTLSRISFEVISQLTFISATLLLVWMVFNEQVTNMSRYFVLACGFALGISVYTYSTARLLSFLMLGVLWVVYIKRENFKKLAVLSMTFLVTLVPFFVYAIRYPNALTSRFDSISYFFSNISVTEKISAFINQFILYWSLDFLINKGDANLRHSIGYGGIVFTITFLLFFLGLVIILTNKKLIFNRFNLFLLANLAISPVAAALTDVDTPHVLRSLLLGYFILIISCFGINFITQVTPNKLRRILIVGIITCLVYEIAVYQGYYFIIYPTKSIPVMNSYGIEELLQRAIDQGPKEVDLLEMSPEFYATEKFYSYILKNPQNILLSQSDHFKPFPGICYIFPQEIKSELISSIPYDEFESQYQLNPFETIFKVNPPEISYLARCYKTGP